MTTKRRSQKKDQMLAGYQFTYNQDKNPYDFITNPMTGKRPDQSTAPSGFLLSRLTDGTDHAQIPPYAIWKEGEWLSDIDVFPFGSNLPKPKPEEEFDTWVVSGEGTPGNFEWRLYYLPSEVSRTMLDPDKSPKHPALWPKDLKNPKRFVGGWGYGGYESGSGVGAYSGTSIGTSTKKKDSGLPYGVRIRCTNCGHWFKTDDLVGHVQCCPGVNGDSDWAIACECCVNLDDTANVKPGFPRAPVVAPPVTDALVTPEGETVDDDKTYSPIPGQVAEGEEAGDGAGAAAS